MANPGRDVRDLVDEEIRRIVADAVQPSMMLRTGPAAERVARAYGDCGMSPDEIAMQIAEAAACAGVAVEISRPFQKHS